MIAKSMLRVENAWGSGRINGFYNAATDDNA